MMTASIAAAAPMALMRTATVGRMSATGIAIASRISRTIVSRPFGVLKNRIVTREVSRGVPLERRRQEQPFDAVALQQSNPFVGTERERCCGKCVGGHRGRRNNGDARDGHSVRSRPSIEDVRLAAGATALVVAGRADGA